MEKHRVAPKGTYSRIKLARKRKASDVFSAGADLSIPSSILNIRHTPTLSKKARRRAEKRKRIKEQRRTSSRLTPRQVYQAAIHSKDWERRKALYYQSHPKRCAACGTNRRIHLHHMVYGQFGLEPDEHLIPLCDAHHEAYHARFGTRHDMLRTTQTFISEVQRKLSA